MRSSTPIWLVVIAAVTVLAVWISLPGNQNFNVQPGLDIQGGLRVLLAADAGSNVDPAQLDLARQIISRRVNGLGVAEPLVQVSGNNRIDVEIPGIRDAKQAINLIKQTGLLEFVDFSKTGSCTAAFPTAQQYIVTDRQLAMAAGAQATTTGTPTGTLAATLNATTAATVSGTAPATSNATSIPTVAATAVLIAPTAAPTTAVTAASTPAAFVPNEGPDFARQVALQTTAQATAQPTDQATAQATSAATAQATAAATTSASGGTPAPTALPRDGSSKDRALYNPCGNGTTPFHTIMDGSGLQTASAKIGGSGNNQWVVAFTIAGNPEGDKFGPFTASHIQQPMAIVLDGQILSAPTIQAALTTGGEITGNFTQQQASDLALQLQYGSLPISLHVESTEQVGASLGADSVAATGRAGVLGVAIVLIFMIVSYRVPGITAAVALLLFAVINFALYKLLGVTITLPALTGFLISIGTAVDGNILIFERIKEELRLERPLSKAIQVGFERAWPSIRDSNISTFMIGLVLFFFGGQFGAGSVRGFSITLMLGLVTNIFTAVIVTRTFLNVVLRVAGEAMRTRRWMTGV